MVFPMVMYGCELDYKESWVPKNWCFWTVVLEKTLESPLDCQIKSVSPKGNQSWIFTGRTDVEAPVLWPPDAKNWFTGKDADAGKDWRQEEKGTTEDKMAGWHHRLNGHESEWMNSGSWWCHPIFSSSITPFSSCPQSFLVSGSFPAFQCQFFT